MTLMYGRNGVLAAGVTRFQVIVLSDDNTNFTVTYTTDISLATGRAGFAYGVNDSSCPFWVDAAGAAANQSITVPLSVLGAVSTDTIYVDAGYSLTDPATTKVYASDYGISVSSRVI